MRLSAIHSGNDLMRNIDNELIASSLVSSGAEWRSSPWRVDHNNSHPSSWRAKMEPAEGSIAT